MICPDRRGFDTDGNKTVGAELKRTLLLGQQGENAQLIRAENESEDLVGSRIGDFGLLERPFEDEDHVVSRNQTHEHRHGQSDHAFDEHPAKVLEMLQK